MSELWLSLDDRRFLRAVNVGLIITGPGGTVWERIQDRSGRRDTRWRRAVKAGWVHELPDSSGRFWLTVEGERVLAAAEQPKEVRHA